MKNQQQLSAFPDFVEPEKVNHQKDYIKENGTAGVPFSKCKFNRKRRYDLHYVLKGFVGIDVYKRTIEPLDKRLPKVFLDAAEELIVEYGYVIEHIIK